MLRTSYHSTHSIDYLASPVNGPTQAPIFGNSCQYISNVTNCRECFGYYNTTWCTQDYEHNINRGKCLYYLDTTQQLNCYSTCYNGLDGKLLLTGSQCQATSASILTMVTAIVLLVVCPLCAVGACTYVVVMRLFGGYKIQPGSDVDEYGAPIRSGRPGAFSVVPLNVPITTSAHVVTHANNTGETSPSSETPSNRGDTVLIADDFIRTLPSTDDSVNNTTAAIVLTSEVKMVASSIPSMTRNNYVSIPSTISGYNAQNRPSVNYLHQVGIGDDQSETSSRSRSSPSARRSPFTNFRIEHS